jgi:hypothetical protein
VAAVQETDDRDAARSVPSAAALGSLLASLALATALLWLFVPEEASLPRAPFDPAPRDALASRPPAFVFVGNSMLQSRLDVALLEELLGAPVAFLARGGGMSAQFYLRFKNHLIASGARPSRVFVMFRDDFLMDPTWRTDGAYREAIEILATDHEPVLNELLGSGAPSGSLQEPFGWIPARPVRREADQVVASLSDAAASWLAPELTTEQRRQVVNDAFALDALRADIEVEGQGLGSADLSVPFERRLPRSFLPSMLDLADDHGLELSFVRVQRRQRLAQTGDDPELATFMDEFAAWVAERGARFHDLSGHPAITADFYGEGDHVAAERRADYTRLFVELLADDFGGPPGSAGAR